MMQSAAGGPARRGTKHTTSRSPARPALSVRASLSLPFSLFSSAARDRDGGWDALANHSTPSRTGSSKTGSDVRER